MDQQKVLMPKHRQAGFAVVREKCEVLAAEYEEDDLPCWFFDGMVGVYQSLTRAEEVSAATIQQYMDLGMDPDEPTYRCKINPTNWYDE